MKRTLLFSLSLLLLLGACDNKSKQLLETKKCPGCNLTNGYYKNADLEGADLSKTNLLGAIFEGSKLKGANFEGAYLFNTSLMNSDLTGVNFKDAMLVAANLRNAQIEGADFTNTDVSGAIWIEGFRCLKGSIGTCYKTSLQKLDATNDCQECNLFQAQFEGRVFENTNLEKAVLHKANLKNAQFKNVNLRFANFKDAIVEGADFTGSRLEGATWVDGGECGDGSLGHCEKH